MSSMEKKRRLISMDKLPKEIQLEFQKRYRNGFKRYIQKVTNHKNEIWHCVPVETEDSLWMIRVNLNKPATPQAYDSYIDLDDDEQEEISSNDDSDIPIDDLED